jgi:membrane-associated phospholipid phosphatase
MEGAVVRRTLTRVVIAVAICVIGARPGIAQTEAPAPSAETAAVAAASSAATTDHGWAMSLVRDVGGDYVHFFSKENAEWLGVGGFAALAVHAADDDLSQWAKDNNPTMTGGATYGSQLLHVPLALAVWGVGAAAGSGRVAETGRDLLRAQISVVSWTYAIKIATQRTRPNGDPRSFPSGHASTSFATAMVLQDHFGWKAGVPAFAAAVYTAISRVGANEHWASDITMGAFVGIASARTVTIHMRDTRISLAPLAVPGGGGVLVTALR